MAFGVGAGYQRFLWNNLFSTVYATPFLTHYYDQKDKKIQNGFQLYLRAKVGYRFNFKRRWFLEPSIEFGYWPVNTNVPDSFKAIEKEYPNYSQITPNLYFGFRF